MTADKKQAIYARLMAVFEPFVQAAFAEHFNSSVWLHTANSRQSIDENSGADNFLDYTFLGKEIDEMLIETYLVEVDDTNWQARLNLRFDVNLAGMSVRFFAILHGKHLHFLEIEDEALQALSVDQLDRFRKAVSTHYGPLRPLLET